MALYSVQQQTKGKFKEETFFFYVLIESTEYYNVRNMSCQRGNASRSRAQKYQNHTAFKNNLHDTSQKTKLLNNIEVANVCERCKKIIEWKIKYRKYKALKAPAKCTKCEQKTVRHSYHIMCLPCAKQQEICPKCGVKSEIVEGRPSREERIKLDAELQVLLKTLSERKRRTFLRYIHQKDKNKKDTSESDTSEVVSKDSSEDTTNPKSREDLLMKLKLLSVKEEEDDSFDSDIDYDMI